MNITAAPPLGPKATLGFTPAGGSLGISWADLGMILQTNGVSAASPADWHIYPGSTAVTNVTM